MLEVDQADLVHRPFARNQSLKEQNDLLREELFGKKAKLEAGAVSTGDLATIKFEKAPLSNNNIDNVSISFAEDVVKDVLIQVDELIDDYNTYISNEKLFIFMMVS